MSGICGLVVCALVFSHIDPEFDPGHRSVLSYFRREHLTVYLQPGQLRILVLLVCSLPNLSGDVFTRYSITMHIGIAMVFVWKFHAYIKILHV